MITLSEIELFCRVCAKNDAVLLAVTIGENDVTEVFFITGVRRKKTLAWLTRVIIGSCIAAIGFPVVENWDDAPWLMLASWAGLVVEFAAICAHHFITKYRPEKTVEEIQQAFSRELAAYHKGDVRCRVADGGRLFISRAE